MRKSKTNTLIELLMMVDDPMDIYGIRTEVQLEYFIKDIERYVRNSREYRSWVFLKKHKQEQTICKALKIDVSEYEGIHIEQDHFPITLFDIVYIIGRKMLSELKDEQDYLTTFQIASEVIKEHLNEDNVIGSISLTTTHHQMRHSGIQDVDIKDINGDYNKFIKKYEEFIPEEIMDRINFNLKV